MKTTAHRLRERHNYTHPSQEDAQYFYAEVCSDVQYGMKFSRRLKWIGRGISLAVVIHGWPNDQGELVGQGLLATAALGAYSLARACHMNAWEAQEERMAYVDDAREHFRFAQADMPEWLVEEVVHLELLRESQSSDTTE